MIYTTKVTLILAILISGIVGLVFGSFLNCGAWRATHGEKVSKGRSHCTSCGHVLSPIDLVPLFSWLSTGGKCRYCKEKVSIRYPITELVMALLTIGLVLRFDFSVTTLKYFVLTCCLFSLTLTDFDDMIIPDQYIIIPAVSYYFFLIFDFPGWKTVGCHTLAAICYGGGILLVSIIFDFLTNKESLGGGDVKLFAIMGLYLGLVQSLFAVFISCIVGIVFSTVLKRINTDEEQHFPFGPAIAAGTYIVLLAGDVIQNWYFGLF